MAQETARFVCTDTDPVVATDSGKIRGYWRRGTFTFSGVPYADAERFQMPRRPQPWSGVRDTLNYGYVCPLVERPRPETDMLIAYRYWPENEHCQNLNIWTPSLDPAAKLPVIIWLHGGGFNVGSAIEMIAYDGTALSRAGNAVIVSVNHRLNILGHLDMSSFDGRKYANSANAGLADLVAALQWIQENITAFGGDRDNVTLLGQSGGGGKIIALGQTPAAAGLFHKAIIMSGVVDLDYGTRDDRRVLLEMLKELGLQACDWEKLETLPYSELARAFRGVRKRLSPEGVQFFPMPKENDWYLGEPLHVGFGAHMNNIPVLVGSTISEVEPAAVGLFRNCGIPEIEKKRLLEERYGDNLPKLIQCFRAAYPGKDLMQLMALDILFREPTLRYLRLRQSASAATYNYLLALALPYKGGTPMWHSGDIPFAFHNVSRVPVSDFGPAADVLEEQLSGAFLSFAETGIPRQAILPEWPAYTDESRATMLFDEHCEVRVDYDRDLVNLLKLSFHPFRSDKDYRDE